MALTPKQEAFAQKYVELGNASEAYRQSYSPKRSTDKTIHEESCKLLADPKVATRVRELQDAARKRHELTVDDIIAELQEARDLAMQMNNPQVSAMVAASMGKAKILGFIKDKAEVSGPNGGPVDMNLKVSFVKPDAR